MKISFLILLNCHYYWKGTFFDAHAFFIHFSVQYSFIKFLVTSRYFSPQLFVNLDSDFYMFLNSRRGNYYYVSALSLLIWFSYWHRKETTEQSDFVSFFIFLLLDINSKTNISENRKLPPPFFYSLPVRDSGFLIFSRAIIGKKVKINTCFSPFLFLPEFGCQKFSWV